MAENVVKLEPQEIGENFRFDSDEVLETAKGNTFDRLVVIGELEDGSLYIEGNANAGETLILIEKAKHSLIFED